MHLNIFVLNKRISNENKTQSTIDNRKFDLKAFNEIKN